MSPQGKQRLIAKGGTRELERVGSRMRLNGTAYAFYATSDPYARAIMVIQSRLKGLCGEKGRSWLAVVHENVSRTLLQMMVEKGFTLVKEGTLFPFATNALYRNSFLKLSLFRATRFSRILFFDSDTFPVKCPDELFSLPDAPLAAPVMVRPPLDMDWRTT